MRLLYFSTQMKILRSPIVYLEDHSWIIQQCLVNVMSGIALWQLLVIVSAYWSATITGKCFFQVLNSSKGRSGTVGGRYRAEVKWKKRAKTAKRLKVMKGCWGVGFKSKIACRSLVLILWLERRVWEDLFCYFKVRLSIFLLKLLTLF
jgi:hypothetical protein